MKTVLKKLTAVVLVVFMAFGAAPIIGIDFSTQASAEKEGIYTYKVTDGKATITDCIDLVSGAINIPATLGGYPVTSIGVAAFHYSILLTSVNIPASVTSIGVSAFSDCESLTSINIPASVTSIGNYAFYECNSLTSIIIPEGVTSLGEYAFFYCTSLTSISIPTSVTSIGCAAFYNTAYYNNAANWTGDVLYIDNCLIDAKDTISGNYVVLAGTIIIADIAVADCTSLTSVTIPEGVTSIGSGAFSNCSYMTSITVASENPNYSSDEYGALFNKDKTTLIQYPIGNSRAAYQIPASVTSIVEEAFLNCDYLSSINIPVSVTSIGNHAFYDCFSLTSVTCDEGSQLTSIGDYAFMSCTQLASVHIPSSITTIGEYILYGTTAYICSDTEDCYAKEYALANNIRFVLCAGHCPLCGASWEFDYTIDTPATCIEDGSKSIHCSVCEETKNVTVIAAGHTIVIDIPGVEPTCTETGLTEQSHCSECSEVLSTQVVIDALGHDLITHPAKLATCTEAGCDEPYNTCSRCDYTTCVEIPATGHGAPITDAAVAATCTATGLTEGSHCSVCQAILVAQTEVPATEHSYGGWTVVNPATCTEIGSERRDCVNCDHYETRDIPMLCYVSIQSPSTTKINYGDTLVLHANIANGTAGSRITWIASGSGVSIKPSADGNTCDVKSTCNGSATVTATVVDANGDPILVDGNEITASQNLTSKAGFFQKLINFFKNLFGLERIILQAFKSF